MCVLRLDCLQERDKVVLILLREVEIEARVVEIPDVQGRGEGVVAYVRCVVPGAASSQERRNAASDQASGCYIVVDAGNAGDGNLQSVEKQRFPTMGTARTDNAAQS
jgi:hypothetical protein